jgi:hypothetical protein
MRNGRGGSRGSRYSGTKRENPGGIGDESLSDENLPEEFSTPSKEATAKTEVRKPTRDTSQIEYLIHQSTLGVHFLFDKKDVARVMMTPTDEKDFFTLRNMERVQSLLSRFLEKPTIMDKERFLRALNVRERDVLIRAYFHLVENAIQSNFELKH